MPDHEPADVVSALDALALDLQRLRAEAGLPSYGDLALRVGRLRQERGVPEARARVGRTTVYDVFRTGRRRVDGELVADVVRVLGADEAEVARWAARCREAAATPAAVPERMPDPVTESVPERVPEPVVETTPARRPRGRVVLALVVACVVVNLLGRGLVDLLHLPLYLDMVGTALAAVVLGPWWGALVGASTNVLGVASSGPDSVPFALVNVAGALVWGYGVRRFALGRTVGRFFLLSILTALVCTVVAVPIILALHGSTGHSSDDVVAAALALSHGLLVSVTSSNLLTSLADKMVCGFVTLAAVEVLPSAATTALPATWMGHDGRLTRVRACSGRPRTATEGLATG